MGFLEGFPAIVPWFPQGFLPQGLPYVGVLLGLPNCCPRVFPWFLGVSHGVALGCFDGFPQVFLQGFPRVPQGFPRLFYGFSLVFLGRSLGFSWSYPRAFPWFPEGFPRVSPWVEPSAFPKGVPMFVLGFSHVSLGFPMGLPQGFPKTFQKVISTIVPIYVGQFCIPHVSTCANMADMSAQPRGRHDD